MIRFEFNPVSPALNGLVVAALLALLILQIWGLLRNRQGSIRRRAIRAALNGLFWLALAAFVLRPVWQATGPTRHALLIGAEVSNSISRQAGDSLGLTQRFRAVDFINTFDSVTVLGQDFSTLTLSRLTGSSLRWIPFGKPGELQAIRWKSVLRQGDMQRVTGSLNSTRKQSLTLTFAGQTLDSLTLRTGQTEFALTFPAFSVGRTETELRLNGKPLAQIRFFARPLPVRTYQFILNAPDFETKTLADWLGQRGQTVALTAPLSTGIGSSLRINQPRSSSVTLPGILITDPANAGSAAVQKAVANGKSVLFIGLNKPEADLPAINRALGTRFGAQRISPAESVSVGAGSGQTALPYRFRPDAAQTLVRAYPVAVQHRSGRAAFSRVGVSLLNETFPAKLSGDSLAYSRLWNALLAPLQPPAPGNLLADGPIMANFSTIIRVNDAGKRPGKLRLGSDTLRLLPDPFNPASATGGYRFGRTGWQSLTDSVDVFVEDSTAFASVANRQRVSAVLRAAVSRAQAGSPSRQNQPARLSEHQLLRHRLPGRVWGLLLLICLTALWVEPKLG